MNQPLACQPEMSLVSAANLEADVNTAVAFSAVRSSGASPAILVGALAAQCPGRFENSDSESGSESVSGEKCARPAAEHA